MRISVPLLATILWATSAIAQTHLKMPTNLEVVDFYLHTVDVGTNIYDNYGHTQIRVRDPEAGTDLAFSWGLFDFHDPGFVLNFYKGVLRYRIGAFRLDQAHQIYAWEGRTVWEDKLNFTNTEKRRLLEKIYWQLQPENREYNYQYFFDNCSTRPRDFIDHALSGVLHSTYAHVQSDRTFRDAVRSHQATVPLTGLGLEVVMNVRLDRPMTKWEEMFLPKSLREAILALPRRDEVGVPIPGTHLAEPHKTMYESPTPTADYSRDNLFAYLLFAGATLCLAAVALWRKQQERTPPLQPWALRLLGATLVVWGLLAGLFGAVMLVSWAWSQHLDLHHSASLWLFWPMDFLLMGVGGKLLWYGRPLLAGWWTRQLQWLLVAHVAALGIMSVLYVVGVIDQNVSRVILVFGGIMLINYAAARRWGIGSGEQKYGS